MNDSHHVFCWMLNCQNEPLPNRLGCEQHPSYMDDPETIESGHETEVEQILAEIGEVDDE